MSGYLSFNRTGHPEVDTILDAIETAGDAYHHTSQWGDECSWQDDKKSYIDIIDEKIDLARIALSKPIEKNYEVEDGNITIELGYHVTSIETAKSILEYKWDREGGCNSCGYHACLYEHRVDDMDIRDALMYNGILHLPCYSDDENSDRHRGINIRITE